MKPSKILGLYIPLILLFLTYALNHLYNKSLYLIGVDAIIQMQKHSSPTLDAFFIFFTFLVDPKFIAVLIILSFALHPRKFQAAVLGIAILINIYIFHIMKTFLTEPRPFWTNSHVKNIGYYCPKDYGSPSGHTQFALFFYVMLLIHFNKKKNLSIILIGLVTVLLVMLSRMYLGGHSLDQVVFGFIVAISLGIMYEFGGLRLVISNSLLKINDHSTKIKVLIFTLALQLVNVLSYFYNGDKGKSFSKEFKLWQKNFNKNCSFSIDEASINQSSLVNLSGVVFFIIGFYIAHYFVIKQSNSSHYLLGKWRFAFTKITFLSYFSYGFINLVFFALPFILFIPFFLILKKGLQAKLLMAVIPTLLSPIFSLPLSFFILKVIGFLKFQQLSSISDKNSQQIRSKTKKVQ